MRRASIDRWSSRNPIAQAFSVASCHIWESSRLKRRLPNQPLPRRLPAANVFGHPLSGLRHCWQDELATTVSTTRPDKFALRGPTESTTNDATTKTGLNVCNGIFTSCHQCALGSSAYFSFRKRSEAAKSDTGHGRDILSRSGMTTR